MNICLAVPDINTAQIDRVRKIAHGDSLLLRSDFSSQSAPEPGFLNSEVVFGNVPPHWLEHTETLRWAQLESVGFGEYRDLDWKSLSRRITLTNLAGFFADPVAQTALAGILCLYRGLDNFTLLRSQKNWQGNPVRSTLQSLSQSTVLLVGYGTINRRLEELLKPFHCEINTFRTSDPLDALDRQLPDTDIVVCTLPETNDTVGLFDEHRLALMKASALFVNCGRGSVVDETALAAALSDHSIAGAVLDVTIEEPLPRNHAFWITPNTLLSQHSGGGTEDELDRKISVFAENLARYKQGDALNNCVDFQRGY